MKSKTLYVCFLALVCCGIHLKSTAQYYGIENMGGGVYTIWMNGGSITTNTQGQYSVTNNQGTYCMGCYATPVNGYNGVYYAPTPPGVPPYQQIVSAPPSGYSYGTVSGNNVYYYNSQNQFLGSVPFGPTIGSTYGVIGYQEGCGSCAQVAAQQQASNQWNPSYVSLFMAQGIALQQQMLATMQAQMAESYNQSNAYNYYYYYYAIQQITGPGGGTPLPPPPPVPPPPPPQINTAPNDIDPAKLPADLNGNRTYVTPAGTPFVLPPGAQVGGLMIDMDNFTNGALYSFYVNGKRYMARESYWIITNGTEPDFGGYFEVVNGNIDQTKPYPINPADYPATPGTTLNVVRITKKDNPCQLVQEVVSYTVGPNVPTTIPGAGGGLQEQNNDIEYTTPVPNLPPNSMSTMCPTGGTSNNNTSGQELDKYVNGNPFGGAYRLRGALGVFNTKNTAKIYLYDCATGQAKYTVTKDDVKTLTAAEQASETQKFNSGNFGTGDQDIAVKGCLENGKWKYEVKLNQSKLAPKTPAIAQALPQIEAELKRQAEDETKKLKSVNMRSNDQSITVDENETFTKRSMDIFEAICAIYDIGKDIINDGKMPEKIWDAGKRGLPGNYTVDPNIAAQHSKSQFQMPTVISGATDQLIDEATGVVQLVKTGLEFVRHPIKTATTIYNGVRTLDREKVKQLFNSITGLDNVTAGGDRLKYQGGKYAVTIALIWIKSLKTVSEGIGVVEGAGKNVTDVQKFVPDGSTGHPSATALKNAADNNKIVDNIDNEKLLTRNVANGEQSVVGLEKNGTNTNVYTTKETDLVDHRSGTPYTYDEVLADAKDIDKPKASAVVNNVEEITTGAGQKGGWNKELNKPKENKVYNVENTNTGKPHKYTTGVQGRVEKVEAELKLTPRDRNGYQQSVKCNGAKGGTPGSDQGGHLIGSRFDGAGEQINLVPMTSNLNLSQWKSMEDNWQSLLQQTPPKNVKIKIEVEYGDPSKPLRPTGFKVTETIDGTPQTPKIFNN